MSSWELERSFLIAIRNVETDVQRDTERLQGNIDHLEYVQIAKLRDAIAELQHILTGQFNYKLQHNLCTCEECGYIVEPTNANDKECEECADTIHADENSDPTKSNKNYDPTQ